MRELSDDPDGSIQSHCGRWIGLSGLALILVLISAHGTNRSVAGDEGSRPPAREGVLDHRVVLAQIPVRTKDVADDGSLPGHDATGLPDGSRIVSFDPASAEVSVLTRGFASAGRPDLSFDGRRVLFVGKREATAPLNVWEMDVDGSNPRQITRRSADCTEAIYLSTLYTLDAAGPVHQIGFVGADEGHAASLYTCRMDGSRIRRIAFNPFGVRDPFLLGDGRLLYAGRRPGRKPALFTINTDGTDVSAFAAVHEPPAFRGMPCETPGGQVIYVESETGRGFEDSGGALVAVSRTRSLNTRRIVVEDRAGRYHSPFALDDGRLLVSYRREDGGSYGVHVLDPADRSRSEIFDSPQWHEVDARVVLPRPEPPGRSSVVDERFDYGYLYGLDAYLSDADRGGPVERGKIDRLQVFRAAVAGPGIALAEELLGEAPVEPDGSFHLEIPARTPLRVRTVTADGQTVRAMRSWIWVMPMEARGCIGCHEDRELAPPNRHALALRTRPHAVGVPAHSDIRESQGRYGYTPPYKTREKRVDE